MAARVDDLREQASKLRDLAEREPVEHLRHVLLARAFELERIADEAMLQERAID
jgi:hypothetical protein